MHRIPRYVNYFHILHPSTRKLLESFSTYCFKIHLCIYNQNQSSLYFRNVRFLFIWVFTSYVGMPSLNSYITHPTPKVIFIHKNTVANS